jgi:hypothetical protein
MGGNYGILYILYVDPDTEPSQVPVYSKKTTP